MGTSPKEEAAASLQGQYSNLANYFQSGQGLSQAENQVGSSFDSVSSMIMKNFGLTRNNALASAEEGASKGLVSRGIAAGAPSSGAWANEVTTAMNPALEQTNQLMTQVGVSKSNTLADLIGQNWKNILGAMGGEGSAIGNMKDSTGFGDVMSVVQSLANVIGGGAKGLSLFGGGGGGGQGSGTDVSGKLSLT